MGPGYGKMEVSDPENDPQAMTTALTSPLQPRLPSPRDTLLWSRLYGSAQGLLVSEAARRHPAPVVMVTEDAASSYTLETEIRFFLGDTLPVLGFPDWETLPYDRFSPHQDIVSQRLTTLHRLRELDQGVIILPIATLMQRLPPQDFLDAHVLILETGQRLDGVAFRRRLEHSGYRNVPQVMEHGEFSLRGSLIDLFPMGSELPYRIDLFDDEIESLRTFDPETQRTIKEVDSIRLLPAREFPFDEEAIRRFRRNYRNQFEGDVSASMIYRDVSDGLTPPGIEYYQPLFFERMATLFDYLPEDSLMILQDATSAAAAAFWSQVEDRHEQYGHDIERPLLPPDRLYLDFSILEQAIAAHPRATMQGFESDSAAALNHATRAPLPLQIQPRGEQPLKALKDFMAGFQGRILLLAESAGRREALLELLRAQGLRPRLVESWRSFQEGNDRLAVTAAPLERGLLLEQPEIAVIAEAQLYGDRAAQRRRRKPVRGGENVIRNLADLDHGAPVVHEEHGVGRFVGLQRLNVAGQETEFLTLEYAGGDKLYVPVSSLHLVSRYTGASPENAPLHKLGAEQWGRARRKAAERARDVAAELLDVYARRAARQGRAIQVNETEYQAFAASFPFEETPDQQQAIEAIIEDMSQTRPMDRVVCGDVGFGKTEVAMRAAFLALNDNRQVVMLVPTTLLAQQHYQNFLDRFADWPFRIETLSRFRTRGQQEGIIADLKAGKVDMVIGTHKLLQSDISFHDLGLVIIDEEHRFGVRQKERLKSLRAEVDILTLTATPIPRTLNMALAGLRDLSMITTPPQHRLAVKTFVSDWNKTLIREACQRELKRGGQVYFLHNEVETIERMAGELAVLVPEARVQHAHGQMHERELEQVMLDFYHRRCNLLVCTTIIESGIDVPNANTIIINRADKLGLAQLHQLRGRVGRSHHRAYAYLMVPSKRAITPDALKRLEAIESLEDLGSGFLLASHDLEIRGAGELLGDEQSGQIQEIGFSLYAELLERAVKAIKQGHEVDLSQPLEHGPEIDLHLPALIPEDYLPDVHSRLVMYKRIANAADEEALRELQVEMIDRFGLLPEAVKNLFRLTTLKLLAAPLGIRKIDAGPTGARFDFNEQPHVEPMRIIELIQAAPTRYRLDGQSTLRLSGDLEDIDRRIEAVEELLRRLGPE